MAKTPLTAWIPEGPPTRKEIGFGAVALATNALTGLTGFASWIWFGTGTVVAVGMIAFLADPSNATEPAYEEDARGPFEALVPLFATGGALHLGQSELGIVIVPAEILYSFALGAMLGFVPVVAVKLLRTLRVVETT